MMYGQLSHSHTSLDGDIVSPQPYDYFHFPANDGVALLARTPSKNVTSPHHHCKSSAPGHERVPVPVRGPGVPLTSWLLPLSVHPTSFRFFLLSLVLELGIFYLAQAVQFAAGVALLHSLYPDQPDYAMTTARAMRIGAAGGAMYVGFVTLRSVLEMACSGSGSGYPSDEEEDEHEREQEQERPEYWHSTWDAVSYLATSAPDVRYAALMGIVGSAAFGRMYDGSGLLYAATAALTGYFVLLVPKAALMYSCSRLALEKDRLRSEAEAGSLSGKIL